MNNKRISFKVWNPANDKEPVDFCKLVLVKAGANFPCVHASKVDYAAKTAKGFIG